MGPSRPDPYFRLSKSTASLSLLSLSLILIAFLLFRLRSFGLSARHLLHRLVRLVSRFLIRGLLRIALLWVAIFLICHLVSPLLVLSVIGKLLQSC
jgi:hypothetical protein